MNLKKITNGIVYVSIISGFILMSYASVLQDELYTPEQIETKHNKSKKHTCSKSKKVYKHA
jgi:hypothetical protein